jgi:hypothetical protein
LMKQAIANLNGEDLVAIAAYVSSRKPPRYSSTATMTLSAVSADTVSTAARVRPASR